jgi:hypothetical protein
VCLNFVDKMVNVRKCVAVTGTFMVLPFSVTSILIL